MQLSCTVRPNRHKSSHWKKSISVPSSFVHLISSNIAVKGDSIHEDGSLFWKSPIVQRKISLLEASVISDVSEAVSFQTVEHRLPPTSTCKIHNSHFPKGYEATVPTFVSEFYGKGVSPLSTCTTYDILCILGTVYSYSDIVVCSELGDNGSSTTVLKRINVPGQRQPLSVLLMRSHRTHFFWTI